jgi:hypothetical protein
MKANNMLGIAPFAFSAWIILTSFYFLFAGQVSTSECSVGLPAAVIATGFAALLHRAQSRRVGLRGPWLRIIARPLADLYPDAIKVGRVLLVTLWRQPKRPLGLVIPQPFRHGDDAAGDAGRRGLVTLGMSLAPNGYVLDIPDGQDVLVMHRLAPAEPDPDPEWPV